MRQEGERPGENGRRGLRDEQEPAAVEAVRGAPRPRSEKEDGSELDEAENAEQKRGVRQPEDEDGSGEILEPGAAGRERVADEVRRERPRADQPKGRGWPDAPSRGPDLRRRFGYARPALCSAA
jgi:hypothetical protein